MNYSRNVPDWHHYNALQSGVGAEMASPATAPLGQSANPNPYVPNTSSSDCLVKPQNEKNLSRGYQSAMGASPLSSMVHMSNCVSHYGAPTPLDELNNQDMGSNPMMPHVMSANLNNGMGLQGSRMGQPPYGPCKGACCNNITEPNMAYQSYGYQVPYRESPPNFRPDNINYRKEPAPKTNARSSYRKDTRNYPQPSVLLPNYGMPNYPEYQKYPSYPPVKNYPPMVNPMMMKYPDPRKPVPYQNGMIYYNQDVDPMNRVNGMPSTKHQMYRQKFALQRYSLESQLSEMMQVPGYLNNPKFQECTVKLRELVKLQQTVEFQNSIHESSLNPISPINLQFDQRGVLVNSSYMGYPEDKQKQQQQLVQQVAQAPQQQQRRVVQLHQEQNMNAQQQQVAQQQLCQQQQNLHQEKVREQEHQGQDKEFANKPDLDVRQFLATWAESEEDDNGAASGAVAVVELADLNNAGRKGQPGRIVVRCGNDSGDQVPTIHIVDNLSNKIVVEKIDGALEGIDGENMERIREIVNEGCLKEKQVALVVGGGGESSAEIATKPVPDPEKVVEDAVPTLSLPEIPIVNHPSPPLTNLNTPTTNTDTNTKETPEQQLIPPLEMPDISQNISIISFAESSTKNKEPQTQTCHDELQPFEVMENFLRSSEDPKDNCPEFEESDRSELLPQEWFSPPIVQKDMEEVVPRDANCEKDKETNPVTEKTNTTFSQEKYLLDQLLTETSFSNSSIPLIPGEDTEEPRMPVSPMEGNCLTKIIKDSEPITNLKLRSDDDEKDKVDDLWMEFGCIEKNMDEDEDAGKSSNKKTENTGSNENEKRERIMERRGSYGERSKVSPKAKKDRNWRSKSQEPSAESGENQANVWKELRRFRKRSVESPIIVSDEIIDSPRKKDYEIKVNNVNLRINEHEVSKSIQDKKRTVGEVDGIKIEINVSCSDKHSNEKTKEDNAQREETLAPVKDKLSEVEVIKKVPKSIIKFGGEDEFVFGGSSKHYKSMDFENGDMVEASNGFLNPAFTSFEKCDDFEKIPTFTTKDGKIKYSTNQKCGHQVSKKESSRSKSHGKHKRHRNKEKSRNCGVIVPGSGENEEDDFCTKNRFFEEAETVENQRSSVIKQLDSILEDGAMVEETVVESETQNDEVTEIINVENEVCEPAPEEIVENQVTEQVTVENEIIEYVPYENVQCDLENMEVSDPVTQENDVSLIEEVVETSDTVKLRRHSLSVIDCPDEKNLTPRRKSLESGIVISSVFHDNSFFQDEEPEKMEEEQEEQVQVEESETKTEATYLEYENVIIKEETEIGEDVEERILIGNDKNEYQCEEVQETTLEALCYENKFAEDKEEKQIPKFVIKRKHAKTPKMIIQEVPSSSEAKVPKIKIRLEDKQPKVVVEKTVPKMKIKKVKTDDVTKKGKRSDSKKRRQGELVPETIPKFVIKRSSPKSDFKCEVSRTLKEASKWQPRVKLRRSWILDCMAKELRHMKVALRIQNLENVVDQNKMRWDKFISDLKKQNSQAPEDLQALTAKSLDENMNSSADIKVKEEAQISLSNGEFVDDETCFDSMSSVNILCPVVASVMDDVDSCTKMSASSQNMYVDIRRKREGKNQSNVEAGQGNEDDSVIKVDSSDESQATIEILPASFESSQVGVEEGDFIDLVEPHFGLEIEVSSMDSSLGPPVLTPKVTKDDEGFSKVKEENQEGESGSQAKQGAEGRSERKKEEKPKSLKSSSRSQRSSRSKNRESRKIRKSHSRSNEKIAYSDLLAKEVLLAKETLRRCLQKSRAENPMKPKTSAEKKQAFYSNTGGEKSEKSSNKRKRSSSDKSRGSKKSGHEEPKIKRPKAETTTAISLKNTKKVDDKERHSRKSSEKRDKFSRNKGNHEPKEESENMPILRPQTDILVNSLDQEFSRSPPVITNLDSNPENSLEKEENFGGGKLMSGKEGVLTVAEIVKELAFHDKATIKNEKYCALCERWFPSSEHLETHLSGFQHRHMELTQRRTIHTLFTLFTGKLCPKLLPPDTRKLDCSPHEPTPLQIVVQDILDCDEKLEKKTQKEHDSEIEK